MRRIRDGANARGHLYVHLRGGLGNHLFQLAAAWSLRPQDDVRVILNPTPGQATIDDLVPGLVQRAGVWARLGLGDTMMISPRWLRRPVTFALRPLRRRARVHTYIPPSGLRYVFEPRPPLPESLRTLRGNFQDPSWIADAEESIVFTIIEHAPAPARQPNADSHLQVISLRRGDYIPLGAALADEYYDRALQSLSPSAATVVVSDDGAAAAQLERKLLGAGWNMVERPMLHRNPVLNDFWLLATANAVVMSNSTFCWWATRVGDHLANDCSDRVVTFPSSWMRGEGERLRRSHWISVASESIQPQ